MKKEPEKSSSLVKKVELEIGRKIPSGYMVGFFRLLYNLVKIFVGRAVGAARSSLNMLIEACKKV